MVTTATSMIHESTKVRSISYTLFLWCIPLVTWMLIPALFLTSSKPDMVVLIQTSNPVFLRNVQSFLEAENVPFSVDGDAILIFPNEKERILRGLNQFDWWEKSGNRAVGQTESHLQTPSSLVSQSKASETNKGS